MSDCIAEIALDNACHGSSFLVRLLDKLVLSNGNVLDPFDFHAAGAVRESLVVLRRLPVRHVDSHEILLQLQLELFVLLLQ